MDPALQPPVPPAPSARPIPVRAYPRRLRAALVLAQAVGVACGLATAAATVVVAERAGEPAAPPPALVAFVLVAVAAPLLLGRAVRRAGRGEARRDGDRLVIAAGGRVVEVPLASIATARPWRLPLPAPGAAIRLRSGRVLPLALESDDPGGLAALAAGGGAARAPAAAAWAAARARHRPRRAELLLRWTVLPLVPALLLFRVHQLIAYGGVLGAWRLHGPAAWLRSLAAHGAATLALLVLLAAATRAVAESLVAVWTLASPPQAATARRAGEGLCRAVLYAGVPALLLLRFLG